MKCQSKIGVSVNNRLGEIDHILIKGNWYECELTPTIYECELTPTIYDPMTFKPSESFYIVTCEDGKFRKYKVDNFLTLAEVRENKLNELGI